jgi:hypothetical protein
MYWAMTGTMSTNARIMTPNWGMARNTRRKRMALRGTAHDTAHDRCVKTTRVTVNCREKRESPRRTGRT